MTVTQYVLAVAISATVSLVVRYVNLWCWIRLSARHVREIPLETYRREVFLPSHVEEGVHPALSTMFGVGVFLVVAAIFVAAWPGSGLPVAPGPLAGIGLLVGLVAPLGIAFLLLIGNSATGLASKRTARSHESIRLISLALDPADLGTRALYRRYWRGMHALSLTPKPTSKSPRSDAAEDLRAQARDDFQSVVKHAAPKSRVCKLAAKGLKSAGSGSQRSPIVTA